GSSRAANPAAPHTSGYLFCTASPFVSFFLPVILRLSDKDRRRISTLTSIEVSRQLRSFASLRMTPTTSSTSSSFESSHPLILDRQFLFSSSPNRKPLLVHVPWFPARLLAP